MKKLWTVVAVMVLAGFVMAAEDNPLLQEEVKEPDWSQFDAGPLRVVASRMWSRIQELEKEKAELQIKLQAAERRSKMLERNLQLSRPSAGPATSPGVLPQRAQPAVVPTAAASNDQDSAADETSGVLTGRARRVMYGMPLSTVRRTMGSVGERIEHPLARHEQWEVWVWPNAKAGKNGIAYLFYKGKMEKPVELGSE